MARPPKYNAEYYTHLADLRNDRRVKAIRTQLGAAGYGLLHMLLEALTDADYTVLNVEADELELLAGDFGVSATEIRNLLQIGEKVKFFAYDEAGQLTCPELNKWLEPVFLKRKRAAKGVSDAGTGVSVAEIPQSKVNKSKELLNSNSESKLPPAPGVGGEQKKIGAEDFSTDLTAQASAPTAPPVAAPPHSSPSSWAPANLALPFAGVKLPFASEAFAQLWGRWRVVADERGVGYRGANSEQEHLIHLTRLSGTDNEALATAIIEQTLAAPTWKNFYALKPEVHASRLTVVRTNRLSGADSTQRKNIGNPSFAGDVA